MSLVFALALNVAVAHGEETPPDVGASGGVPIEEPGAGDTDLRRIDPTAPDYRTPRAGEGFRTHIFGRDVAVPPRDRRSESAWDLGVGSWDRWPEDERVLPFGSLYFWRRPSEASFFRGTVVGVYDDITYAHALADESPFEAVLSFTNDTVPADSAEHVDGERIKRQELRKGEVRGGVGLGYRRQVRAGFGAPYFLDHISPHSPDNMLSLSATIEPAFLYFDEGKDTDHAFHVPDDTFELRGHLQMRFDSLERNVLELAHRGFAVGLDAWQGWREDWERWGIGKDESSKERPRVLQGYGVIAGGIPGLGERHRVTGSVYAGVGSNLDRFSAPHLGGGPSDDEFLAIGRPIVPGAGMDEFWPDHYAIGLAEYRYELFFFTYLSARASVAQLDRDRFDVDRFDLGATHRRTDTLTSLGARLTTGFLFSTRLRFDYNYNFDVIRNGRRGANEFLFDMSHSF